jgi:Predicted nucleic-acid-binding protein containing a Zn-ribbon
MQEERALSPDAQFDAHLAEGRFMIQRARRSGAYVFYPRVAEPGTGDQELEWVEVSGRGTVYATTIIRPRPPAETYNVALIDLAEGPRMMSRVEGLDPESVRIGMAVRAAIIEEDGRPLVIFRPEGATA